MLRSKTEKSSMEDGGKKKEFETYSEGIMSPRNVQNQEDRVSGVR